MRIRTVSSNVAYLEQNDSVLKCNCIASSTTVYLNPSRDYQANATIIKVDDSTNTVTIYPYGSETIDGAASVTLTTENDTKVLLPVDGGWAVSVDSDSQLVDIVTEPTFHSTASSETVTLGAELLDGTGWTSTGWTGSFATGFIHTVGQVTALSRSLGTTGTKIYQVSLTLTSTVPASPPGFITVTIGGSQPFDTYKGGSTTVVYNFGIQSVSDGNLVITPTSALDGTITNISVKEITTATIPALKFKDSTNTNSLESRYTTASLNNIFMGKDAGELNTTGDANTIIGHGAMPKNTSGFWNSALGVDALASNTVGSRNIALGRVALNANISGHRNIAVGTFSLNRNTHGAHNVGVGADTLWFTTTGSRNIALGTVACGDNVTGSDNVGIGYAAMEKGVSGTHNIGLGSYAMHRNTAGNYNIALGAYALERVTDSNNIAIGYYALNWITAVSNSVAIGYQSQTFTTAGPNISLGANSLYNTTTGVNNVGIGDNALKNNTTGERNIAIGNNAGTCVASSVINRNVIIGHNAGTSMETGADYNVIIGSSSGVPLSTGNTNILIGYGVNTPAATTNNHLNIGNTIYGDLSTDKVGISVQTPTAHLHIKASTGAANSASFKINAGTLLGTPEAGAIEFDGTNLYFTTGGGTRKTITAT